MIVFDLPSDRHAKNSLRVAAFGSCRVRTPAFALEDRGEAVLPWVAPNVTHTADEALQDLLIVQGKIRVPEAFRTYVFGEDKEPDFPDRCTEIFDSVDVFLVEISDIVQFRIGELIPISTSFMQYFVGGHPAALLPWLRELHTQGAADPSTVDAAIANLRDVGAAVTPLTEDILRRCRFEWVGAQDMLAALDRLMFDKSRPWIFVSHFDVPGAGGAVMTRRRQLIRALGDAAAALGATFFDPTVFLHEYGRETVLEGKGADLFEYASTFVDTVTDRLVRLIRTAARADAPRRSNGRAPAEILAIAGDVNEMLLSLHGERCASLGPVESGLYNHYKLLLDRREIVRDVDLAVARIAADYLPAFDRYAVSNAGLGELAFILARSGLIVTACEEEPRRFRALQAGLDRLRELDRAAAERCTLAKARIGDCPVTGSRTLAVAPDALMPHDPRDEAALAGKFVRFDALLIEPRQFLRLREDRTGQQAAIDLIKGAGFDLVREYPRYGLAYVEREMRQA